MTVSNTSIDPQSSTNAATDRKLRQFVGYRMKRAYLLVQEDMAKILAPLGLRTGTFSALGVVVANPGISQTDLSNELHIKRSGVVVVVDELETAGALERAAVKGDRRRNALIVTRAGQRLWEKAELAIRDHEADIFADLSAAEVATLSDLLARVGRPSAGNDKED